MKVLLVDDHLMFRLGIRSVIEQQDDIDVVGEAASYLEAISMIEDTQPDVTVLDLRMPGAGGLAVLEEARKRGFATKFLILSSYASEEEIYQAIRAGAHGYILKDVDKTQLLQAIHDVNDGRRHIPLPIQTLLKSRESMRDLTPRELEVLQLVVRGLTNKEISSVLGSSANTIRNQTISIFAKLGVADRAEAATAAHQRGIVVQSEE
ncbi:MAG: response regulator transcription factor [Acidobacteriota bacterium]